EEDADLFPSTKKEHGDYNCQNVLTIWPKFRERPEFRKHDPQSIRPKYVGKAIMIDLPGSAIDMIEGRPSVLDNGFVTFLLSPKWIVGRIHKMTQDGIHTWAPKLPVKR
nr:hypothetical protein [Tanacetum cinerariifolium]